MEDKEKIKAEIERLLNNKEETSHLNQADFNSGRWKGLMEIKRFVDSLPKEPTSEDFEEVVLSKYPVLRNKYYTMFGSQLSEDLNDEIRKYFLSYKGYPHVMDKTEREIKKAIIYFANWQKEKDINKACEWLKENIYHRVYECGDRLGFPTADFLNDFRKAMEE